MNKLVDKQAGVVTVEFVLLMPFFFLVVFGIIGFTNAMYVYGATANATRYGARLAVLCDPTASQAGKIRTKMVSMVPNLTTGNITIAYDPVGCTKATCTSATVSVNNFQVSMMGPSSYSMAKFTLPNFSTTLVRERMSSTDVSACA